jgi:hypothetical protein
VGHLSEVERAQVNTLIEELLEAKHELAGRVVAG